MQYIYLASMFAGALVCLLAALLLISRRKEGERSRIILSVIVLFSVFNYISRFIVVLNHGAPPLVVSTWMLLLAIFMIISYILYPIEVVSPGFLNFRRIVILYSPWLLLVGIYLLTLWAGMEYAPFNSLLEMFPHAGSFEVWFRLLLCLLIFMPVLCIFFIPYTRRYNNTDRIWMRKYAITISVNTLAYLLILTIQDQIVRTLYYYVSVGCSLYIVYMELFVRLIGKPVDMENERPGVSPEAFECVADEQVCNLPDDGTVVKSANTAMVDKLATYMQQTAAWRDPDLSLNALAFALCTNRTTLSQSIQDNGYDSYSTYINKLRIADFIAQIESGQSVNYQAAFFDVGFRSRATALRNFRQITGTTPSEYFQKER